MEWIILVLLLLVMILLLAVWVELRKNRQLTRIADKNAENIATKNELSLAAEHLSDNISRQMAILGQTVNNQTLNNQQQMEALRSAVSGEMRSIRQENAQSMAQIRQTVDEKLETTLEKRLGESFNLVGTRLEQVHQGLGEMQNLASNVGDLQKLLKNWLSGIKP